MYTRRGSTERNNQIRDFNTKEALETVIDFECKSNMGVSGVYRYRGGTKLLLYVIFYEICQILGSDSL